MTHTIDETRKRIKNANHAIDQWLPELSLYLVTPSSAVKSEGLQPIHFPMNGVEIKREDGITMHFDEAFMVPKLHDAMHVAVFTKDDGCHDMRLTPDCSVNIMA